MYSFCILAFSGFSVRLLPASNTDSEISSNPERDKQPTWEKTRFSKDTTLYFYISIPCMKYLVHIHFIVYRTLSIFSLFHNIRVSTHIHTQGNSQQTRVSHTHTHTHTQEYAIDYIRIFLMFLFSCISWYMNLILFGLLCFECSFVRVVSHRVLHLLFNNEPNIICGGTNNQPNIPPQNGGPKIFTKLQYSHKSNQPTVQRPHQRLSRHPVPTKPTTLPTTSLLLMTSTKPAIDQPLIDHLSNTDLYIIRL